MSFFDYFKKKVGSEDRQSKESHKEHYSISGDFLYMDGFSGEFHQSSNGQFILAWKDQYDNGSYILLENGKVKLRAKMTRPNDGRVSNSGVFVLNDWTSKNMTGVFHIISPDGETFIKKHFKANLAYSGISEDGLFAVCQTLKSDDESDSSKLFFFDVINRKLLWKKSPDTGWAKSYRFDTDNRILYLIYTESRTYRYTFDGDFIDSEIYGSDCISIGNDVEFLEAAKQWKEKLFLEKADPSEYNAVIVSLKRGLKRFTNTDTQSKIYRLLGESYFLQGNNSETIKYFEIALKLNPSVGVKRSLEKLKKQN